MNVITFYKEVKSEVSRITWPTNKETLMSVALVVVMVIISGLFFLLADSLLYKLVKFILD